MEDYQYAAFSDWADKQCLSGEPRELCQLAWAAAINAQWEPHWLDKVLNWIMLTFYEKCKSVCRGRQCQWYKGHWDNHRTFHPHQCWVTKVTTEEQEII